MTTTAAEEIRFEPFDPAWRAMPLEVFEALRDRSPVYRAPSGTWVLSRYETVRAALADPAVFSSAPVDEEALGIPRHVDERSDPELVQLLEATFHGLPVDREELATVRTVIGSDGAKHSRQRRLISRAFSNQDERAFPDPTAFDIDRSDRRHVAFGHGVHLCVGAHLARLEAQVALEALVPHLHRFRLADEPLELAEEQLLQGFRRIPLVARCPLVTR